MDCLCIDDAGWCFRTGPSGHIELRKTIKAVDSGYDCDILSAMGESTIKQINRRVKGSEKFWNTGGAEALLQLSADDLSQTDPLTPFWRSRHSTATGQRHYRAAA